MDTTDYEEVPRNITQVCRWNQEVQRKERCTGMDIIILNL
jgi:hypothetical protein